MKKGDPTIKNLSVTYEKHDSFESFRSKKAADPSTVVARLEQLRPERLGEGYFRRIVEQAINDVLHRAGDPRTFKLDTHSLSELSKVDDESLPRYLFYRYRYDVFPEEKHLDDFPPCLQVEPASICNYRCVFCYQTDPELTSKEAGHMGVMPLDLFKRVIDEAEDKCEAITLASRGEPLVAKDIVPMLKYMSGKFLASKLNTNASLLTEEKCHGILESDLHTLVFSCDAAEEPLYSQLRVNGSLEIVLKNVRRFKEIKEKSYPRSKLVTRVSGVRVNNRQSIDAMDELWGELVDEVAFVKYNPWENTYERPVNDERMACTDLWRRCFIWWDGRVNPCDVDYKSELCVGNVNDSSISALWLSERYSELRRKHLSGKRCDAFPCNRCTQV